MSELLGKETIDTNTFGKSTGRSGNYSTNYQISGRELLTPDAVSYTHLHNVVFVGYDEKKEPKYAAYRSTNKRRIMGDCSGSKRCV